MKFVLLHEGKNDEGIRAFFMEVWEVYVKVRGSHQQQALTDDGAADDDEPIPHGAQHDNERSV
jgi:hypothetical protein